MQPTLVSVFSLSSAGTHGFDNQGLCKNGCWSDPNKRIAFPLLGRSPHDTMSRRTTSSSRREVEGTLGSV